MNAYYENANTRYNDELRGCDIPTRRFGDGIISFICAIIGTLTCPAAVALEKTAFIFALFFSFCSVVGAIDAGNISMLLGIIICSGISLCEYALLKSLFKGLKNAG